MNPVDKALKAKHRVEWCLEQVERAEKEYREAQQQLKVASLEADEYTVKNLQTSGMIPSNLPRRQYNNDKPALIVREAKDLPVADYFNDGMYAWATKEHKLYLCQVTGQWDIRSWCLIDTFKPEWSNTSGI